MITIEMLMEEIKEELDSSIQYAKLALEYKYTRPALADIYIKLAPVEMSHAQSFRDVLSKIIMEEKNKGMKFPNDFDHKWNHFEKKIICKMECAKRFIDLYR